MSSNDHYPDAQMPAAPSTKFSMNNAQYHYPDAQMPAAPPTKFSMNTNVQYHYPDAQMPDAPPPTYEEVIEPSENITGTLHGIL